KLRKKLETKNPSLNLLLNIEFSLKPILDYLK
ncbi:hypothetical protein MPH_01994, partial [Macrophomina phaseolina MS6]